MNKNLIVPIYIDTNALLDLLASIEGGFSLVEKVTSRTSVVSEKDKSATAEAGTEFGVPNVLSLLKVKLGGSLSSKKGKESGEEIETERFHIYGSLLHRLREYLYEEKLVRVLDAEEQTWDTIEASDFIEIKGIVRPNPLVDSFSRIDRLIGIMQLVTGLNFGSSGKQTGSSKGKVQSDKKQMNQMRQFMKGIISDIDKDNVRTFVVDIQSPENYRAVALIYTDYLRDQTMTEIEHKEYRLLGKVVRKIEEDSGESIDLLRGTGLGGIDRDMIGTLFSAFNQIDNMDLPEVKPDVFGPALEIVPIAIFV